MARSSGEPSRLTTKISTESGEAVLAESERGAIRTREKGGGSRSSGFSMVFPTLSVMRSVALSTPGGTIIGSFTVPLASAVTGPIVRPATSAVTLDPGLVTISIVSEPVSGIESQASSRSPP